MPIATETGFNDMLTVNETGPDAGRYLFRTHETATNASIVRIDLLTGASVTIFQRADVERLDGLRWTSYGTLVTGEEVRLAALADPDVQTDPGLLAGDPPHSDSDLKSKYSGLIYEVIDPLGANPTVVARPDLGGLSHEGIEEDGDGRFYVMDEYSKGSIYRFVPDTLNDLAAGQLQVLRMVDNDLISNPDRLGNAQWVDLNMADARINARGAADDVSATLFERPEDAEITTRGGTEFLNVPITGEDRILSIELAATPVTRNLVDRTTIDLATGVAVGTALDAPDNVTSDAAGRIFFTEDAPASSVIANGYGNDIWQAVDLDGDGTAESLSRFASLASAGAEPTGIYINPLDPAAMFVNVQHPDSGNDITFEIRSLAGDYSSFIPLAQSVPLASRPETDPFDLPEGFLAEIITQRNPVYAGDNPLLDASVADESLDMTSADFEFASEISASPALYAWTTVGGHHVYAEGTGFTAAGGLPIGGSVDTLSIDLSGDGVFAPGGSGSDIDFIASGLVLALADLDTTSAWFWTKLLKGEADIVGSSQGDMLIGNDNANTINGNGGRDVVHDRGGSDFVELGAGSDYVRVGGGVDTFNGGSGQDYISYYDLTGGVTLDLAANTASGSWAGNDTISGFEGASGSKTSGDTIFGTSGSNTIKTFGGNDSVHDLGGADMVELGSGDDYVLVGGGMDSYKGGSGKDYISYYNSPGGVTLDLAANTASGSWAGNDTIAGFERASGSKTGGDTIFGTSGSNTIKTFGGNDSVHDLGGADIVELGSGDDYVLVGGGMDSYKGGSGKDYISYYNSPGGVTLDLAANTASGSWAGNDTIVGFERASGSKTGGDTIFGTSGSNTIKTFGGNDSVHDLGGADIVELGSGDDYVLVGGGMDSYKGGSGKDYISYYNSPGGVTLDLAANTASGSWAGNDTIVGFEGASGSKTGGDTIFGTSGSNTIKTFGGADVLHGRAGNDTLLGGADADTFRFDFGDDMDTVKDFENNIDTIEFHDFATFTDAAGALTFATQVGADVVFNFGGGDIFTVENTTTGSLLNDIDVI